jgi:DNA-binding response OmpR family regulator
MKPASEIKLLVAEDDPFFLRVLHKRLTAEGYQVITVGDGREAMKAIVTHEPDLVVSDWMMPEVDGLELCQSVKTGLREAAPYFILLTARGEISDKLLGLTTGADDYLVKPCDVGELLARVRAGLRVVMLTQELRRTVAQLQMANAELAATRNEAGRGPEGLPVCFHCKRVRDRSGEWIEMDRLATSGHSPALELSVCPDCQAVAHEPSVLRRTAGS